MGEEVGFDLVLEDGERPELGGGFRHIKKTLFDYRAFTENKDMMRKGDVEKGFRDRG